VSEAIYGLIGALGGAATITVPVLTGRRARRQKQRVRNEFEFEFEFDRMMDLRVATQAVRRGSLPTSADSGMRCW
jgi:hypothetical protein